MDVDVRMCLCLYIIVLKLEMGCLYMHGTYSRYRGTGTHNCIPTCTSIQNTHVTCRLFLSHVDLFSFLPLLSDGIAGEGLDELCSTACTTEIILIGQADLMAGRLSFVMV